MILATSFAPHNANKYSHAQYLHLYQQPLFIAYATSVGSLLVVLMIANFGLQFHLRRKIQRFEKLQHQKQRQQQQRIINRESTPLDSSSTIGNTEHSPLMNEVRMGDDSEPLFIPSPGALSSPAGVDVPVPFPVLRSWQQKLYAFSFGGKS